jgi:hypothetical protein
MSSWRALLCRWEDDIKITHKEVSEECIDWIHLAKDRDEWQFLMNTVIILWVPLKAGNLLSILGAFSFSKRILLTVISVLIVPYGSVILLQGIKQPKHRPL